MKYKNVVLYSSNLPPESVGGIETNAYYLIRNLLGTTGVKLHVLTLTKNKFVLFRSKKLPVEDRTLKAYRIKKSEIKSADVFLKLLRKLKCAPDDTVIYHNTLDLHRLYGSIKRRGYRQVARSGGNDIFFMKSELAEVPALQNFANLDLLFVNSEYSFRRATEAGFDRKVLRVIRGGCSRERQVPRADDTGYARPIILSCCRLVDFKGLEDAIDACRVLDARGLDFTYLVIGDGNLREALRARIEQHGLQRKCHLLGRMPPEQVHAYYQLADVYLSSSKDVIKHNGQIEYVHTETMGRSLCEAQAYGVPVVSTNAGGSPEMIEHGVTGLVVEQGNVAAIADALTTLILDNNMRGAMGEMAARHAEQNLSWAAVFEHTLAEMDRLA